MIMMMKTIELINHLELPNLEITALIASPPCNDIAGQHGPRQRTTQRPCNRGTF